MEHMVHRPAVQYWSKTDGLVRRARMPQEKVTDVMGPVLHLYIHLDRVACALQERNGSLVLVTCICQK